VRDVLAAAQTARYGLPFLLQVTLRGADEDLVFLVHARF
jgi:hypothetical protein